jgi:CheY-like chemotaxis protein
MTQFRAGRHPAAFDHRTIGAMSPQPSRIQPRRDASSASSRRVRVPRRDERFRRHPSESSLPSGSGAGSTRAQRRVLVVDDEPAMRTLCRVNLSLSGMEVLEASDGEEALRLAAVEAPDLVLLDIMMPGLSGFDVAAALGDDARTRAIPVVFLTARVDPRDRARGRALGAVGYVTKPFDPIGMADLIERTLDRIARGEREQLRNEITREP